MKKAHKRGRHRLARKRREPYRPGTVELVITRHALTMAYQYMTETQEQIDELKVRAEKQRLQIAEAARKRRVH